MKWEIKMSNLNTLRDICHKAASNWWIDQRTGQDLRVPNEDGSLKFNVPEKLCLIQRSAKPWKDIVKI